MNTDDKHTIMREWIKANHVCSLHRSKQIDIHPIDDTICLTYDINYTHTHFRLGVAQEEAISMRPIGDFLPFKFSTNIKTFQIEDGHLKSFNNLPSRMTKLILDNCTCIPIADLNIRDIMNLEFIDINACDLTKIKLVNNYIESISIGGVCGNNFYDMTNYDCFSNIDHLIIYLAKQLKNLPHLLCIRLNRISFFDHNNNNIYTHIQIQRLEKIINLFLSRLRSHEYIMDCAILLSEYDFNYEI